MSASAAILAGGCLPSQFNLSRQLQRPQPELPIVGMLAPGNESQPGDPNASLTASFLEGMRELGWIDGQNVRFIKHSGGYTDEGMRAAVTDLLDHHVDVIWTNGTGIRAASDATSTIPIVSTADELGVQCLPLEIEAPRDFPGAFEVAVGWHADALLTSSGNVFSQSTPDIVRFAATHRLPAMYYRSLYVGAGGLMAYGINYDAFFKHSAVYVDKILRGAHPADLPIEQPTVFDFAINLKTAQTLGISIPNDVLIQATELIQ